MIKTTLKFSFGEIDIFENYVLTVMKEGITVLPEYNVELLKIANTYFKDRPFGYITNRINSYSVDPRVYLNTSKIKNLVAFAVVSDKELNLTNSEVEKIFLRQPFEVFSSLEEAISWVDSMTTGAEN
ncbi:hypothetical protein [Constantimarinum furrinae]|uniref:STAS/SEC14 domain-containing protein n=1 Tax=Constantimarinum furrinae TaxID=2562285 RepID=A0A7G8PWX4_9FLAO|nr:hypothetical protein [Constantimarinum furrinae]QNJ98840.1 hypothetical protein ALE3EI_2298 [Constantimarinum furrinae]